MYVGLLRGTRSGEELQQQPGPREGALRGLLGHLKAVWRWVSRLICSSPRCRELQRPRFPDAKCREKPLFEASKAAEEPREQRLRRHESHVS